MQVDDSRITLIIVAALVVAAIAAAAWKTIRQHRPARPRRQEKSRNNPVLVMMPRTNDEMFNVLDSLGIPAEGEGGTAKAAIYQGYKLLTSGRAAEGVSALRDLTQSLEPTSDPDLRRVAAVAHYLIGKAHEASGDRAAAMAEFSVCLRLEPDYLLTRSGLDTVHPTEH